MKEETIENYRATNRRLSALLRPRLVGAQHMDIVHPDGSRCDSGCDVAPYRGSFYWESGGTLAQPRRLWSRDDLARFRAELGFDWESPDAITHFLSIEESEETGWGVGWYATHKPEADAEGAASFQIVGPFPSESAAVRELEDAIETAKRAQT